MPRWIYGNPPESAPQSEQKVAAFLENLPAEFSIRWKFSYPDLSGFREGDFVIQGPDGHILVLEVKGGELSCDPATGRWNTSDGKNPFDQLDAEWKGVLSRLETHAQQIGVAMPFVDRVLGLPEMPLAPEQTSFLGTVPRSCVAASNDLQAFPAWWSQRFGVRRLQAKLAEARQLFDGVFVPGAAAEATRHTLDFADRVIERQTQCHYELLDALSENRQLLFSGGPGTGKTWLALEQAARWAAQEMDVLLLCYNLELEKWLKAVAAKKHKRIYVRSYESLARSILKGPLRSDFKGRDERTAYFDHVLPRELAAALPGFPSKYDALVVDEAQDHNTSPAIEMVAGQAGWWSLYLQLLTTGYEAPIAVFYDEAQRLVLRGGKFEPSAIADILEKPVSIRLRHPVRYTRQLRSYFRGLVCGHTQALLRDMLESNKMLPEGPPPELLENVPEHEEGRRCAEVIKRWIQRGEAKPHEIMVLFPRDSKVPAWIEQGRVDGVRFHLGTSDVPSDAVVGVSVHRAKGLERRAVVVVGLPDWAESAKAEKPYDALTFVQGVTRAQQLLAVITRPQTHGCHSESWQPPQGDSTTAAY